MARTTVNIDDDLLDQARRALGTKAVTSTVNAALAAAVRQARLEAFDVRLFDVTEKAATVDTGIQVAPRTSGTLPPLSAGRRL